MTGTTQKIAAGRLMAATRHPYLASALWALVMIPVKGLSAMARGPIGVDKYWRCYFDPDEVETYSVEHLSWILEHEVWHLLRGHPERGQALGVEREPYQSLCNVAADCEINDDLNRAGAKWPIQVCTPENMALREDRLMEEYYNELLKRMEEYLQSGGLGSDTCPQCGGDLSDDGKQGPPPDGAESPSGSGGPSQSSRGGSGGTKRSESPQAGGAASSDSDGTTVCPHCGAKLRTVPVPLPGGGESGLGRGRCGSAAHGVQQPWERGEPSQGKGGRDGIGPHEGELIRRDCAKKIQDHGRSRGTMPAGWSRWAEGLLLPPKVDWRRQLATLVRHAVNHVAGMVDYSYRKPSRRQAGFSNVVLPSMRRPEPSVAVVVDTSGSMSDDMLQQALSEIKSVLNATGQREGIRVLSCDADVHACQKVMDARQVKLAGGGGTDMRVGIDQAMALHPRPDIVIVLTDGYTPWPDESPKGCQVVIGIMDGGGKEGCPEWAKVVDIDIDEAA